jgi:hypothetical protein
MSSVYPPQMKHKLLNLANLGSWGKKKAKISGDDKENVSAKKTLNKSCADCTLKLTLPLKRNASQMHLPNPLPDFLKTLGME